MYLIYLIGIENVTTFMRHLLKINSEDQYKYKSWNNVNRDLFIYLSSKWDKDKTISFYFSLFTT